MDELLDELGERFESGIMVVVKDVEKDGRKCQEVSKWARGGPITQLGLLTTMLATVIKEVDLNEGDVS